jgi:hypothetical protein
MLYQIYISSIFWIYFIISVFPFLWAMSHLVHLKHPLPMKAMWSAICFFGGIMGVFLYVFVVYLPETSKKR